MLLAIDIGNSQIKFGIFDGEHLLSKFSITTDREATPETFKAAIGEQIDQPISKAIACSVVPDAESALLAFIQSSHNIKTTFVRNDFDFGLKINYKPLESLGTDRLVNAFAGVENYGMPCIVCSFGTATTIDVIDKDRVFLGGIIAPGMTVMAKALHEGTAKLPVIDIDAPASLLGNSTETSIRAGIVLGHIAMVEGLVGKVRSEIVEDAQVIATGGRASMIAAETDQIDIVDENLTLDGLRRLQDHL